AELVTGTRSPLDFTKIMGKPVTLEVAPPGGQVRYLNGLVRSFLEARQDHEFIYYRAEIVPTFWLWTLQVQSRIFQQLSVAQILEQVLDKLRPHVRFALVGQYRPRAYCVQYRESDFAFASRLMEEEGIYYFFEHKKDSHVLVVTDSLTGCKDHEPGTVHFDDAEGEQRPESRITRWHKRQTIRSNRYTLTDYHFEMPEYDLKASVTLGEDVQAGQATHSLQTKITNGPDLEHTDFPGDFAKRYDGINPDGAAQMSELQHLFEDNERAARLRAQQQAARALVCEGEGTCGTFLPGHKFRLDRHFSGNGEYLLTSVEHTCPPSYDFQSGSQGGLDYRNRFEALPVAVPFRPQCLTPRPQVVGPQTAVVVGPKDAEIFLDKYGRVKVQFHWGRHGQSEDQWSCWVRVAQLWAGNNWGAFFWPRVGHEVVVLFTEGDPDQPLIVGSVYNQKNLPPVQLPEDSMLAGIKSCIFTGDPNTTFNAIVFHDNPEAEYVHVHSEKTDMSNSMCNKVQYVPKSNYQFHGNFPGMS
ncbi:MAG: type VI secretion system Vgr family protein, partial [Gemmataceae bacterium]